MSNKLYIEEYSDKLARNWSGDVLPIPFELLAIQEVAVAGASAQSDPFNARTRFLLITADVDAKFAVAADPEATNDAASLVLWAKERRPVAVDVGQKIAVIEKS